MAHIWMTTMAHIYVWHTYEYHGFWERSYVRVMAHMYMSQHHFVSTPFCRSISGTHTHTHTHTHYRKCEYLYTKGVCMRIHFLTRVQHICLVQSKSICLYHIYLIGVKVYPYLNLFGVQVLTFVTCLRKYLYMHISHLRLWCKRVSTYIPLGRTSESRCILLWGRGCLLTFAVCPHIYPFWCKR